MNWIPKDPLAKIDIKYKLPLGFVCLYLVVFCIGGYFVINSVYTAELSSHMMKEEQILFPMVRELDVSETAPVFHCGSLANPIQQMESEHDHAGSALEKLRELTDGYTPPDWACNTYRAMLDALAHLEQDLHQHIHKENNVLFPRALELEQERRI